MRGTPSLKFNYLKQRQSLMVDYDLSDIWRARNPTFRQLTWRQTNPVKLGQLDFFLISNSLQFDVRLCKFLSPIQSDHSPIVLKISSCAKSDIRGRGYWKFNNSLTEDPLFVESLQNEIRTVSCNLKDEQDPRVNWEFLKYKIFRFSKRYANEKAEKRRRKRVFLENKVLDLEKQIVNSPSISDALVTDYEGAKTKLENLYNYIADGAILRCKVRWYEEGEKCSKYFLSLEKRNKTSSCIRKLLTEDGQEITNPEHVRKEIKSFYENLYTKRSLKTEMS